MPFKNLLPYFRKALSNQDNSQLHLETKRFGLIRSIVHQNACDLKDNSLLGELESFPFDLNLALFSPQLASMDSRALHSREEPKREVDNEIFDTLPV